MLLGLKARALGIRVVERTDDHVVFKMARWFGDDDKREIARRLTADAKAMGKPVRVDIGDRLIRVERIHGPGEVLPNGDLRLWSGRRGGIQSSERG